jgi:outer membrane immunogenic protein
LFGFSATSSEDLNGFIGGGQIGANYQIWAFVFGIERDFDASNQSKTTNLGFGISATDKINWVGTVRGRFGGDYDGWFFYVTAGGGEGKFTTTISSPFGSASGSKTHGAWVAGAALPII